mmetsp:Transcript_10107/g.21534  ORF Transcript_10107/g.21534 Transcript_10107/m.21534 type:complete len:99 (+) Transcript_10107:414-710(+)
MTRNVQLLKRLLQVRCNILHRLVFYLCFQDVWFEIYFCFGLCVSSEPKPVRSKSTGLSQAAHALMQVVETICIDCPINYGIALFEECRPCSREGIVYT